MEDSGSYDTSSMPARKTQGIRARMRRPVHQSKLTFAEPLLKFLQDYQTLNRFRRPCWQGLTVSGPPPTE